MAKNFMKINKGLGLIPQASAPSDPSNGDFYYDSSLGIFRKYENGAWSSFAYVAPSIPEVNAILNPIVASDLTGWTDGTSHTGTRVTSGSPLDPTVVSALSIAASTTASESSTSGTYYTVSTMPTGLRSKKLKVEFYYTTSASQTWTVGLYASSTRMALSTDVSGATTLPAGVTGKFVTYVDADSSSAYTLHFTRTAGSGSTTLLITNVIFGPGIQAQGAVVGPLVNFTPAFTNSTGLTFTGEAQYQRIGDSMAIYMSQAISGAGSVGSPLRLTLPISGISAIAGEYAGGNGGIKNADINNRALCVRGIASQNYLEFSGATSPTSSLNGSAFNDGASSNAFYFLDITALIPIAEWAGSGTVNLAQNDVEYASNSSTATAADDTTSFTYGPLGNQIQNITATLSRRVRFPSPIQTGDEITVEFSTDRIKWQSLSSGIAIIGGTTLFPATLQNGVLYGAGRITMVNETDLDVLFGQYAANSSTYGAAGAAWSSGAGAGYWRVRKEKAGVAVGFGIAGVDGSAGLLKPGQMPGLTTGTTIAAGYIGEKITSGAISTTAVASTTFVDVTGASITLTPGVWTIKANFLLRVDQSGGGAIMCQIFDSANTYIGGNCRFKSFDGGQSSFSPSVDVNISTTTTYKLRIASTGSTSSFESGDQSVANDADSIFYAVRSA